jgi:endoglucanase
MKKRILIGAIALALVFCLFVTAACTGETSEREWPELNLQIVENEAITANESAAGFVAKIKIGWNLGNTLDAHPSNETSWGNPRTTKAMITAIKEAGFNTIRIPVSWSMVAPKPDYTITSAAMSRVKEVVGYAVENNLYIILNSHHDNGIFKLRNNEIEESKKALQSIWSQIAEAFKDYDYNLIFEGLNEPRTIGSQGEWNGGTPEERNNLNTLHQLFVDTVRASGGNNEKRILMIPTYAASADSTAMSALVIPNDPKNNVKKIIVSLHSYVPNAFTFPWGGSKTWSKYSDTGSINSFFNSANSTFITGKGVPVIAGEFGAVNKNNEDARAEWAEYYVSYGKSKGIPCVLWDNGAFSGDSELFGFLNRGNNTFPHRKFHIGLMLGAGVMVTE